MNTTHTGRQVIETVTSFGLLANRQRMWRRCLAALGVLGALVAWPGQVAAQSAPAAFNPAVNVSNTAGQLSELAAVTLDGATIDVVWSEQTANGPQIRLRRSTNGGASSNAFDLNDAGQVVGNARYPDGTQRAAFWPAPGEPAVDLGALSGATRSAANAINERGEIAGEAFFADTGRRVALFWPYAGAPPIELSSLGGANSQAVGLDNRGRIVGQAQNAAGEMRACLWTSASEPPIDLGPGFARAINARGTIAEESEGRAVVWPAAR